MGVGLRITTAKSGRGFAGQGHGFGGGAGGRAVAGAGVCRRRIVEEVAREPGLRDGWAWGAVGGTRAVRAVQLSRGEGAPQPGAPQNGRHRFPQTRLGHPLSFSVAIWPQTRPRPTCVVPTGLGPGLELGPLFGFGPFSRTDLIPPFSFNPPGAAALTVTSQAPPSVGLWPVPQRGLWALDLPGASVFTCRCRTRMARFAVCTTQSASRGRCSACRGGAPQKVEGEAE